MTTPTVDVTLLGESLATVSAIVPTDEWPVWLQLWLTQLDPKHSPLNAYEMSLQFTTDATITQLNRDYRQQDQATDVLSFAALEDAPLPPEVLAAMPVNLGDLIVSVETAQRQCEAHGHSLTEELAWLVAHGLLHLLGWDHPTEARLQAMWTLQRSLLAQVGLSLPATAYTIDN
ncbi:MAG: rRNA maturation RNase YbeY [Cyanobacteria bacterium P01_D01_bin.115]